MDTWELLEVEARKLRDIVYGKPITESGWKESKEHWIKDIQWLKDQVKKMGK